MITSLDATTLTDKAFNLLRQAELLPGDPGAVLPRQVGALSILADLLPEDALTPQGIKQVVGCLDSIEAWLQEQLAERHANIDIHGVLESRRQIAHIWSIEDVAAVRPDLNGEQAWKVLQNVERRIDSELGISWETLRAYAEELYPEPGESGQAGSE